MASSVGVSILGATGVGAGELLRLLTQHDNVEVVSLISSSSSEDDVSKHHPHLTGFYDLKFIKEFNYSALSSYKHKVLISALPHGSSGKIVEEMFLKYSDLKIIDLSGDLRLKNLSLHNKYYGADISQNVRLSAVYGLPELNIDHIKSTRLVSNPGCLATASTLSLLPLTKSKLIEDIHVFAITGSSGAGKKQSESVHHAFRNGNFSSYKSLEHQHIPEIEESVGASISFIPHRAPLSRGIFVTASATLTSELSQNEVENIFKNFYSKAPFVRRFNETPELTNVVGSNFFDYSIKVLDKKIVICGAIDNLIKGMAGTAIQNLNLMCGLDQKLGIFTPSLRLL